MGAEQELKQLKREFQEAKNEQVRLETRLDEAKKRRKEAHAKITAKGYEPKELQKVIARKEEELEKTIEEAKQYLPSADTDDEDFDDEDDFE
jgi:predicted  nucleic acid-binding Zn-ribbon protein